MTQGRGFALPALFFVMEVGMKLGLRIDRALASVPGQGDVTPAAFTFTDVTGVSVSTVQTSNTITISGMSSAQIAPVSITGGTYSKNGGAFVSTAAFAQNGDTFAVRHTSSASALTATNTVLTVGGVSDTYTSTTA